MKRIIFGVVILLFIAGVTFILGGLGYFLSPQSMLKPVDAIVAISGGETDTRTAEAVRLYKQGLAKHIIFSGAALDPNSPSNARAMAQDAQADGVPADAIELDEIAQDTRGNADGVSAIAQRAGYTSIILVTSPYHQRRADIVFQRALGDSVTVYSHSSVDHTWRRSAWWATPYSRDLTLSEIQKVGYELIAGRQ